MKLLVVEDEEVARMQMVRTLSRWFDNIVAVPDGDAAWREIRNGEYDIVITDWLMPGIDGLTLCHMIRSLEASKYVYVILVTSRDGKEMLVRGLEAGADDYIVKPYEMDELRVRVQAGKRIISLERELSEKNNLLLSELETSVHTLRDMLPDRARRWGGRVQIDWLYQPSVYIGGDFFNVIELTEQHLAFYLLDVSGHGVSAALSAVSVSSLLNSSGSREGLLYDEQGAPASPALVASRLNQRFQCKGPRGFYFTIFYAVLDLQTLSMRYIRAGQTCPLVMRQGQCITVDEGTIPVGFFPEHTYTDNEMQMQIGDTIILFSDGVNETSDAEGIMFGVERIEKHFMTLEKEESTDVLERLAGQLRRYSGLPGFEDDVTVLMLDIVR
ncbi:MAG TPA: SpoIIE family protein phosphatase [Spirochaetota bacterium]|nr:SpoIIE family protein phosphatase [Spirochaetota bacterium]